MFQGKLSLIAMSLFFSMTSLAFPHPGHSPRKPGGNTHGRAGSSERTWTDTTGRLLRYGSFVAVKSGDVQIRQSDESLVSLKLSQLSESDQQWVERRVEQIRETNKAVEQLSQFMGSSFMQTAEFEERKEVEDLAINELPLLLAEIDQKDVRKTADKVPEMAKAFEAFVKLKAIKTRWDNQYFYVESNGIPDHPMMIGITSWQQQVPIPQKYIGENAWQIPLHPVQAKNPQSAKGNFLRGAIAVAANGIPIFNPLNNRGDDAYLFGELDEFGGHCGRADDYHYHIAPVHLEKTVGKGLPIAYALDGYPIYGYEEPDGSKVVGLDQFNGHKDAAGNYHYHSTKTYPYLNGGFYGEVTQRDGQVDPQPRAEPIRPDLRPLKDAKITDFVETKPGSYQLTYDVKGKKGSVSYSLAEDGSTKFAFVDTTGHTTTETYSPKRRGPNGGANDRRRPPPRRGDNPPPPRTDEQNASIPESKSNLPKLVVTSPAFEPGGSIPVEYTGDGASASPPIEWKNAPAGTKSFAVNLWHIPGPGDMKSYWVVYNIPANATKLSKNDKSTGTLGLNDKKQRAYDPMKSKGPGLKQYHITVYALSEELKLAPESATRAKLLEAIKDITLAEGTLDFQYERKGQK